MERQMNWWWMHKIPLLVILRPIHTKAKSKSKSISSIAVSFPIYIVEFISIASNCSWDLTVSIRRSACSLYLVFVCVCIYTLSLFWGAQRTPISIFRSSGLIFPILLPQIRLMEMNSVSIRKYAHFSYSAITLEF